MGATVPQKILNQSLLVYFRELCTVEQIFRRVAPEKGGTQPRRVFRFYLFLTSNPPPLPYASIVTHNPFYFAHIKLEQMTSYSLTILPMFEIF